MDTEKLLGMLLEAIDYSFLQTDGSYDKTLTYPVIDKVQYIKEQVKNMKVKEVDLEKEYLEEIYSHLDSIKDTADRMTSGNFMHNRAAIKFSANTIAKVLELMGLKIKKGE